MKKGLFIKILKYLGVAFIGAFVGMGALIGVSSCFNQNTSKEETTIRNNLIKHNRKITATSDIFNSDKTYYFVAKNYAQSGEGVFYQDSISLTNSAICNQYGASITANIGMTDISFTLINGTNQYKTVLRFSVSLDAGVYKLQYVYFMRGDTEQEYLYNATHGYFHRNACAFLGYGFYNRYNSDSTGLFYLNTFFDIYELGDSHYQFAEHINYYAPYGQDIDSFYVNDSSMTEPSSYAVKTILENYPFYSGGMVFDTIRLRYQNAIATSYLDENGNRKVWMTNNFASFTMMEYVNSATNYIVVVNDRIYTPWQESNQSGFNVTKNSKWVSEYYKDITFFVDIPQSLVTKISILNNSSYEGGYFDNSYTNNVGLSNVFDLLRLSFTSWLPILNITIVPGITLGLLLFLPLIVGIIILVIWVVKR